MYSKVIVPLDGSEFSEQALPYATLIAGRMSVPIELVESYNILPPAVRDRHTRYIVELMLAEARSNSEKYLSSVRHRLEGRWSHRLDSHVARRPNRSHISPSKHGRGTRLC